MHEILHFVQNDKHGIFMIPTQSQRGKKNLNSRNLFLSAIEGFRFGPPNKSASVSSISARKVSRLHRGFCIPQEQRHNAYNREKVAPV
jgi:hypothetical protein